MSDRTLLRFAECWSSHNADEFLSLFTEDCVYEDVAAGRLSSGKAELRASYEMAFTAIPDHRMNLKSRFATDDRALLEWVATVDVQHSRTPAGAYHLPLRIRTGGISR